MRAGDQIVKTRTGPGALSVAETDALLYLPGRDVAKLRLATTIPALSPGWQGSFRELLEAGSDQAEPAWAGFRPLRVDRGGRGEHDGDVDLPGGAGREPAAGREGRAVPDPAGRRRRAARAGAQLLAVLGTRRQHLPDQRQGRNRTARPAATWTARCDPGRRSRGRGAARRLRAGRRHRPVLLLSAGIGVTPVLAMLHALAAAGSTREVWWVHSARRRQEFRLAAEAHALLAGLPHAHEHVCYSQEQGRLNQDQAEPRWACRPTRARTCAGRTRSWPTCGRP